MQLLRIFSDKFLKDHYELQRIKTSWLASEFLFGTHRYSIGYSSEIPNALCGVQVSEPNLRAIRTSDFGVAFECLTPPEYNFGRERVGGCPGSNYEQQINHMQTDETTHGSSPRLRTVYNTRYGDNRRGVERGGNALIEIIDWMVKEKASPRGRPMSSFLAEASTVRMPGRGPRRVDVDHDRRQEQANLQLALGGKFGVHFRCMR
jgi:hypothetical protein